jgi:AcrR family transcriptional regulator
MPRLNSTADCRREAVITAGARLFAQRGLMGTPTTEVAEAAGISQPYIFRLFHIKIELTVAVINHCHQRIHQRLSSAAAQARAGGEDVPDALQAAYRALIVDGDLLIVLQGVFAATAEPRIREVIRANLVELVGLIAEETGVGDGDAWKFLAAGMLGALRLDVLKMPEGEARLP